MAKENSTSHQADKEKKKQSRISQGACPQHSLEDALKIPRAIKENFAGQPVDPMLLSQACGYSPASSTWRTLTGSAIAYGLTEGGYNSKEIALSSLGERIVSPLTEGDDIIARNEAALLPTILKAFFSQYDRNKFPREDIAKNVLTAKGVPMDRVDSVYEIIRANGHFTNMIQILSGSEYIRLTNEEKRVPASETSTPLNNGSTFQSEDNSDTTIPADLADKMKITIPPTDTVIPVAPTVPRIYISHGKNSSVIVGQLKELLSYGQMEPVISIEKETPAISVPDKVFDDMRSCVAGIIHICPEEAISDDNHIVSKLNENVLIEIGAALALYGKKIIILCQQGVQLPSNLQGLYRCEYAGDQLDYSSTIKLLKTLQELRKAM